MSEIPGGDEPCLPSDQMAEAEVSLRLAFHLLDHPGGCCTATVSVDGAHVECHGATVFPIRMFLRHHGWEQTGQDGLRDWRGRYDRNGKVLVVTTQSGIGDVTATVGNRTIRAECKKGPLRKKPGSPEYPLVREAIGQLMTVDIVGENDLLVVAVPRTEAFRSLRTRWQGRPLVARTGIQIVLVGRDGTVEGLKLRVAEAGASKSNSAIGQ